MHIRVVQEQHKVDNVDNVGIKGFRKIFLGIFKVISPCRNSPLNVILGQLPVVFNSATKPRVLTNVLFKLVSVTSVDLLQCIVFDNVTLNYPEYMFCNIYLTALFYFNVRNHKQTRIFLLHICSISYLHLRRARFTFQSCFSKEITATTSSPNDVI